MAPLSNYYANKDDDKNYPCHPAALVVKNSVAKIFENWIFVCITLSDGLDVMFTTLKIRKSLACATASKQQQKCANVKWQWDLVGWMLADHRDGLPGSSFCLILDSSVGLSAGIQSAKDWVSETPWVRILHSAEEDDWSPFDSKIACLCQSMYVCM